MTYHCTLVLEYGRATDPMCHTTMKADNGLHPECRTNNKLSRNNLDGAARRVECTLMMDVRVSFDPTPSVNTPAMSSLAVDPSTANTPPTNNASSSSSTAVAQEAPTVLEFAHGTMSGALLDGAESQEELRVMQSCFLSGGVASRNFARRHHNTDEETIDFNLGPHRGISGQMRSHS